MPKLFSNSEPLEDTCDDVVAKAAKIPGGAKIAVLRDDALKTLRAGSSHPGPLQIPQGLHVITTDYFAMRVNCFLIHRVGSHRAVLFDTGADETAVERTLSDKQLKLMEIYITHAHGDHIAVCEELCRRHHCPVRGMTFVKNGGAPIRPGEVLNSELGPIRCQHIPGHAEDSLVYEFDVEDRKLVVVGDVVFSCSIGGLRGCFLESLEAIRKLLGALPGDALLLPGHGPLTTVAHECAHNPFL